MLVCKPLVFRSYKPFCHSIISFLFSFTNISAEMSSVQEDSSIDELNSSFAKTNQSPSNIDTFTLISWNIDGLSEKNLHLRTKAVCNIIKSINADIIQLQEVVPESEAIIREQLEKNYTLLNGSSDSVMHYYIFTAIKKSTIKYKGHSVIEFEDTKMGRNMLLANVLIKGKKLKLINAHLESTKDGAESRKKQLLKCYDIVTKAKNNESVLFGGDLNIRDYEILAIGGIPRGVSDLWQVGGSRKEAQYTWDMTRNDNLKAEYSGKGFKPRYRFDRIYYRSSVPPSFDLEYFGLIGIERLRPHQCFPSDHWGILTAFHVF